MGAIIYFGVLYTQVNIVKIILRRLIVYYFGVCYYTADAGVASDFKFVE